MNNRSLGLQRRCQVKVNLMFQAGKYENPRWPPWNLLILIYQLVIVQLLHFCLNLYKIMNMVSFDKSKEPKIKNKDGSHECNSLYSVCKYCIALFFLIPLNWVKISSKSELFSSCQVFFSFPPEDLSIQDGHHTKD